MGGVRLRVVVVAIVVVIATVVGWAAPATAAGALSAQVAGLIDCTSLQSGYYQSMHVTATVTGLPGGSQFTGDVRVSNPPGISPFGVPVVADTQGTATVDVTVTGQFVADGIFSVELYAGTTRAHFLSARASGCASGVAPTGRLTADAICPTRYVAAGGVEQASTRRIHGTLGGFLPSTSYTFSDPYTSPPTTVSAVSDAAGAVQVDFTSDVLEGVIGLEVFTSSQEGQVASAPIDSADPCPAMQTKWPSRPVNSDVNGDGLSDLVAIDFSGRLLDYQNSSGMTPRGGLPFSSAQTIGSRWGPQYGFRMESMGDLTADGYSELVAVRSDGTLVAYYNNMNSNPGRLPYTSGTLIGSGWQPFTSITLGDVNGDGFADLIARKSDGTVWLYMNHFLSNPGHLPFSSGVPLAIPGLNSTDDFVAADVNRDGFSDIVSYGNWWSPNRVPAGSPQMFIDEKGASSSALDRLSTFAPRSGWAAGAFDGWADDTGVVVANPNGDGSLLYLEGLIGPNTLATARVIGSGWQSIRQIIS